MAETLEEMPAEEALDGDVPPRRRRWRRVLGWTAWLLLAVIAGLWLSSDTIVDNIIGKQLRDRGLPGTYKIESTGFSRQVLTDLVIGDPAHPDLTIARAEVTIEPRFGFPAIGEVRLVRPRIHGSWRGGKLSFGSLDPMLFGKSAEPFRLPDINLIIEGGGAELISDAGPVGFKLAGRGNLQGGFAGELAAVAPGLNGAGCEAGRASAYGKLATSGGRIGFTGPIRLAALICRARGLNLASSAVQANVTLDPAFDGAEAKLVAQGGALALGRLRVQALNGRLDLAYRASTLTARYDLAALTPLAPEVFAREMDLSGTLRGRDGLARLEAQGTIKGDGLRLGADIDTALASAETAWKGSLAEPLVKQLRTALARHLAGSRLAADYIVRSHGGVTSLVVPRANLTGGTGEVVLALSRLQASMGEGGPPRLAGNFSTGGAGIPRITGRLEQRPRGTTLIRMGMADYRAGSASLSFPEFALAQAANGTLGFSGRAMASGILPGGEVRGLDLPLDGRWEPGRMVELWRGCRDLRFAALTYASLRLERQALRLCPDGATAMVRSGPRGTILAARAPALDFKGRLGDSALAVASGPVSLSGRGKLAARDLGVIFGTGTSATRLSLGQLTAQASGIPGGSFSGGAGTIGTVPLIISEATGHWSFAHGRLSIAGMGLRLRDSAKISRFEPLVAQDAALELFDGRFDARAVLREPKSLREVMKVAIVHDLQSGTGQADLAVAGLSFDNDVQPVTLTPLALGVIANARGVLTGTGRIDWNADKVTSSGRFSTEGLDFAAAFGPAKGVAGTVVFTDLLGLVTAPDQKLTIASINPGIEAEHGELSFALQGGGGLAINGASWPFLDGRMTLLPTTMKLGAAEVRRYVLRMEGISASRFIEKMEMGNIAASGLFDGELPLVFDQNGGRIAGGSLISRAPGGNVSYVGELTYKDLSAMGNFAFEALRSLNYKRMTVGVDGDLTGEFITRIRFDGVTQGVGARRNFVTRQLGRLPIRFNVTVRAPYYDLIAGLRKLTDPAALAGDVRAFMERRRQQQAQDPSKPQQDIQHPESEKKP